jgi:hypothetical protein
LGVGALKSRGSAAVNPKAMNAEVARRSCSGGGNHLVVIITILGPISDPVSDISRHSQQHVLEATNGASRAFPTHVDT